MLYSLSATTGIQKNPVFKRNQVFRKDLSEYFIQLGKAILPPTLYYNIHSLHTHSKCNPPPQKTFLPVHLSTNSNQDT